MGERESQVQPLPNCVAAVVVNCSLKASKLPNFWVILSANSPDGSFSPSGDIICQKNE